MNDERLRQSAVLGSWTRGSLRVISNIWKRRNIPYKQTTAFLSPLLETLRIEAILPYIQGPCVLDIGCGRALLADYLRKTDFDYVGVDRSADVIAYLRNVYPQHAFMQVDIMEQEIPLAGRCGTIVMTALLEHIHDPAALLMRLVTLLETGGLVAATTPLQKSDSVLRIGATVGLFSSEAHQEHEVYLDRVGLIGMMEAAGLEMVTYRRFALGFNQLVVARRP